MKALKFSILLFLVLLAETSLFSQSDFKRPRAEEFHEKKWQYLVEKARLTQAEADLVKPVFLDYEKTMWEQHEKNRRFFKSVMEKRKNDKPNFAELNDRYAEEELIQAQYFKNYHLRLKVLLSPETLFRYYRAEREFKRELLQNLPPRPQHENRQQP